MAWNLDFISEEDFKKHVRATIMKYGEKLESYDLKRFNSNLIDPIKLIFDKSVYRTSWEEIVNNEIFRQRDKSNNNDIGYFHQNIFSYFKGCEVPQAGWDVIYRNPDGIQMPGPLLEDDDCACLLVKKPWKSLFVHCNISV